MSNLIYVELSQAAISQDVLRSFDCKHPDFNDFLHKEALQFSSDGNGVTYILVDETEYQEKNISVIFAFATIQAMSLHYHEENPDRLCAISCAEIKYFAITRKLQKQIAYTINKEKYYSTIFFECFLQELYELSTKHIGFQAIFLRANKDGEKLYRRKNFIDASQYIVPYTEDDPTGKCIPMILNISSNIYGIFGVE